MQEVETYELSNLVENVVLTFPPTKANNIMKIFNLINTINEDGIVDETFNLSMLESKLEDIITNNDNQEADSVRDLIDVELHNSFKRFIGKLGIKLTEDQHSYGIMHDIIQGVVLLKEIDTDMASEVIRRLEEVTDDPVYMLVDLIDDFVPSNTMELYEVIEEVEDRLIEDIKDILEERIRTEKADTAEDIQELATDLIKRDKLFCNTNMMYKILTEGYDYESITVNKKHLYNVLEHYKEKLHLIPYEIVITLLMSYETKDNILEGYKEYIDVGLVSYLEEDTITQNIVKESIDKLISETMLKGRT